MKDSWKPNSRNRFDLDGKAHELANEQAHKEREKGASVCLRAHLPVFRLYF